MSRWPETAKDEWWKDAVIYEIYVRSFQDSNGDGVGDLPGVIQRLDYLRWLGVNCLWLTSFYASPQRDFGYDVSDHCAVHSEYGSLEDFDRLLAKAHEHGFRVIIDFVPCHTSEEHPWFKKSLTSQDSPYRDWYLWHDGRDGGKPPTNWLCAYGGSAWELHGPTGQFYFHYFLKEQPSLNWRHRCVQHAMMEILRFWLARGVDGFRVDASHLLVQDRLLRDNPPNEKYTEDDLPYDRVGRAFTEDQADNQPLLQLMRRTIEEFGARLLVGETHLPASRLVKYYQGGCGLHFPLNYRFAKVEWKAPAVRAAVDELEGILGEDDWPSWALGNHDQDRVTARLGNESARLAALLLLTLRGTPVIYYGDEIGLVNTEVPLDGIRDPAGQNLRPFGLWRDPHRTPMQWNAHAHAGFSEEKPWLPVSRDHRQLNVESQQEDDASMLQFVRRVLAIRRESEALRSGDYVPLESNLQAFVYLRGSGRERWLIGLNFSKAVADVDCGGRCEGGAMVLSTRPDRSEEPFSGRLTLLPHEGVLVRLDAVESNSRRRS